MKEVRKQKTEGRKNRQMPDGWEGRRGYDVLKNMKINNNSPVQIIRK